MENEEKEKIEILKDMIGSRNAFLETIKVLNVSESQKNLLLRASAEVRKSKPNLSIINSAYDVLVPESTENNTYDSEQDIEESQQKDGNNTQFCPKCGTQLKQGAKFCNKCGTKIKIDKTYHNSFNKDMIKNQPELHELKNLFIKYFFQYFVDVIKYKYVKFDGVASRSEYWFYALFYALITLLVMFIVSSMGFHKQDVKFITLVLSMALLMPTLAINVRRMHDINLSGWVILLSAIPIVNILYLVLLLLPTKENSKYR